MDEKIKDQEVLLVKDQKDENLKVVTGTDEKGGLKTVPPTAEHEQSFLKFDKHGNALENFLSNFMRQFKNPNPSLTGKNIYEKYFCQLNLGQDGTCRSRPSDTTILEAD